MPRHRFAKLEAEHGTGLQARSFSRWGQVVHLLSMQLTARASLRDGIASLTAHLKSSTIWESSRWPAPPLPMPTTNAPHYPGQGTRGEKSSGLEPPQGFHRSGRPIPIMLGMASSRPRKSSLSPGRKAMPATDVGAASRQHRPGTGAP